VFRDFLPIYRPVLIFDLVDNLATVLIDFIDFQISKFRKSSKQPNSENYESKIEKIPEKKVARFVPSLFGIFSRFQGSHIGFPVLNWRSL